MKRRVLQSTVLVLGLALASGACGKKEEPAPAKVEAPAEPAKVEAPAEPAKVEAPAEPAKVEVPAEPAKVEVPAEPAKVEVPAEPEPLPAPTEPMKGDAPAEPAGTDEPSEPVKIEVPDTPTDPAKMDLLAPEDPPGDAPTTPGTSELVVLKDAALTLEIADRLPVARATTFSGVGTKIQIWLEFDCETPTNVKVAWRKGDKVTSELDLEVGKSPHWRTWARKTIGKKDAGAWAADVFDANGVLLQTLPFTIEAPIE